MEGGGSGDGGKGKWPAARRSSRQREVAPLVEEEIPEVDMAEEETPEVDLEAAAMALEQAMKKGEMRAWVSWLLVLAVYLALLGFQRERLDDMGFEEILRMERMRADAPLTQALRSRWDAEAAAFVFPWGHMIPSLEDVSRITGLRVHGQPVSGFTYPCYKELAHRQLGGVAERADEQLQRLTRGCWEALADEPGAQADLDLRRFLIIFLGRLLFATRVVPVHCQFLPLLEDLGQVWAYLHLPGLRRGTLERPSLVPIARRWVPCHDTHPLGNQLASLQDAIDLYPQLDVVWQPYLEGPSACVRVRWSSLAETGPLGLVRSNVVSDDAYLQAFTLKYGAKVYRGMRRQVDVTGKIASLRALLHSAAQDRMIARREVEQLRTELAGVRRTQGGASSSGVATESSQSVLTDQLASAVRRVEEAESELTERVTELETTTSQATYWRKQADTSAASVAHWRLQVETLTMEVGRLHAQTDEMTSELVRLRTQGPTADQAELVRLSFELLAQQTLARGLQDVMTAIGRSRSRSRSDASGASGVTGASVRQFLAGSSSRRRNEKEERRLAGEASTRSGRGGGEMLPPPDRQEGSGESGSGQ
ncbi:hypothetical protein Taro_034038 [Colocasia esculenta]|uniref:Aminotransferase-like plant mobile domain-containing protein n=1 Tax=Colocasia esculenta TaxID=4460 RepID=A0A843WAR0_COLES|nr:hypothetical protein [Colocasia esculenta]